MTDIVITSGVYGQRVDNRVKPRFKGEVVTVSEQEAERLMKLGVAAPIEPQESIPTSDVSMDTPAAETRPEWRDYASMTIAELAKLGEKLGADVSRCKVKADYLAAIAEAPATDDGDIVL